MGKKTSVNADEKICLNFLLKNFPKTSLHGFPTLLKYYNDSITYNPKK